MSWIFVDKGNDGEMRSQMRRSMRGGYRNYGGSSPMMHNEYDDGYRMGYRHGWEDKEDDEVDYRRQRDSRGRYV